MILLRLIAFPLILALYLVAAIVFTVLMSAAWIFTGAASVDLSWPRWK